MYPIWVVTSVQWLLRHGKNISSLFKIRGKHLKYLSGNSCLNGGQLVEAKEMRRLPPFIYKKQKKQKKIVVKD